MKKTTKSALAVATALLATSVVQAHADTVPGWYAGGGAGVNFTNDAKAKNGFGSSKFDFDPGYDLMANGGYAYDSGWRVEGEVFHSDATVDHKSGSLQNTDLFANGLYDFNLGWIVTPYVGAGVGLGLVGADQMTPTAGGGSLHGTYPKLAYQGIAGAALPIDQNWSVTADYRYIATTDPKFKDGAGHDDTNNSSHNILLGVRYNFDVPQPAPVMAPRTVSAPYMAPRPAARAPMVAPIPQTFQVFFDFNRSDLTPEAKRIIASAAQEYKQGGFVRIVVTGHTDTVGSAQYNKALSDRRAASVRAEFENLGVPVSAVVAQGVGKSGQLVPTNDQVREAQNRRAEIVFDKQ